MVKFWFYSSASLIACAGLLYYTYLTRQQFYPAVIYLVTSKISVLILGNAGLVLTMLFGRLVKSIFFGTLRDAEVEILHENVRYAITETCLALTIFREEINFHVVVLFTSLVFLKIFHWLSQSRIEYIEQTDVVSRLTHMRLVGLMTILAAVDMTFVVICGMKVIELGPSVFILFGFEFLILFVTLVAIFLRYVLYVIDVRMDGNWPNKFTYLFYLELVSEIVKLVVYLIFFMLIFTYYGMPLHIVRDLWVSIKNLQRRIASYFRYRKITSNLNERFPNPTEEELQETDRTCIICREEMTAAACKKLPCTHIFHIDCLKMWVQRQQTCPTCRSTIPTRPARPPVVPETQIPPAGAPAPGVAPGAVPGVPAAAPPAAPHAAAAPAVPGVGVAAPPQRHAAMPPAFAFPPAPPAHPAAPHQPTPHHAQPAAPAAAPAPGAVPPFPPGYPHPFMSPFMFGPAMGVPFGYGLAPGYGVMPPFGFHPPAHGAGTGHTQSGTTPGMDPASIQRHIEQLHAQLAALQAASHAFGVPGVPVQGAVPATPASAPPAVPTMTHPTAAPPVPTGYVPPVSGPSSTGPSMPAPAQASSVTAHDSDLEEKAPIPTAASASLPSEEEAKNDKVKTEQSAAEPVEMEIPRVLTDAERRREELRRRYARIYGGDNDSSNGDSSNSASASGEDVKDE